MSLGERIKLVRRNAGLNQTIFGNKIGVTQVTITNYERNKETPSKRTLIAIANTFNINLEWLESGVGEMDTTKSELENIFAQYDITDDLQKRIVANFVSMSGEERTIFLNLLNKILK